jgi:NAD(P)H-hydrate epimerase
MKQCTAPELSSQIVEQSAITCFFTESGLEVPAVTAAGMREVDRIAIEETGPNLHQMMENAGRNLAQLTIELLRDGWQKAKIVVLAGGGGNGGGGICAARHLANRCADVTLILTGRSRLQAVPTSQYKAYLATSGKELDGDSPPGKADIILDALVGYGLRSAPAGATADLIGWANATAKPIVALDVPSGIDATTGVASGEFIRPTWTMTLALPKTGLLPERTGELYLADIGIPETVCRRLRPNYRAPFGAAYWVCLKAARGLHN